MRIGIQSPIVFQLPGAFSPWEASAGADELVALARAADQLGFHHLTCAEHVGVPEPVAQTRGGTYWDPLVTLSLLAGHTRWIRLATQVVVLGYHHPLELAKRYGTLDRISRGRLILGVGVGSLEEEFEQLGVPFTDRGPRADESMRALRASFGRRVPEFHGEYWDYEGFVVDPHGVQEHLPMWVGGYSMRSLRRAVNLGDGWVPFGLSNEKAQQMLSRVETPDGFDVVLPVTVDPLQDPDRTRTALDRAHAAGATIAAATVRATSLEHYLDQLAALAELGELSRPEELT